MYLYVEHFDIHWPRSAQDELADFDPSQVYYILLSQAIVITAQLCLRTDLMNILYLFFTDHFSLLPFISIHQNSEESLTNLSDLNFEPKMCGVLRNNRSFKNQFF